RPFIKPHRFRALARALLVFARVVSIYRNRYAGLFGDDPNRLGERAAFDLHDEIEDATTLRTAEAFENLFALTDVKTGGLFIVEGAAGGPIAPFLFQRDVVGDYPHNVGLIA